jgi:hypothetical protein
MPSRASTPPKHSDELGKLFNEDGAKLEDTDHVGAKTPDADPDDNERRKPSPKPPRDGGS